jgi:hypothetical protein
LTSSSRRRWPLEFCAAPGQITRIRLNGDLASGTEVKVITSEDFQTPTTAARLGKILAVVNAKFDTDFPPTADQHEVVLVRA